MLVEKSPKQTSDYLEKIRGKGRSIGFVPTMGYLHRGHASLIERAKSECDFTTVSIFVNPTQFGLGEDFQRYPRDLSRDLALCREHGVDLVFNPSAAHFYPRGYGTYIDVGPIGEVLEGVFRPGHLRGVATVVVKLLNVVRPHRAYFGRKDAQQAVVVSKLVRELNLPVEIRICPTIRESDGLAVSSRNVYLSADERRQAPVLYRSLVKAGEMIRGGETDSRVVIRAMRRIIVAGSPEAGIDYISINHRLTLEPMRTIAGSVLVSLAVRIGGTRLIDNMAIHAPR